MEFCLLMNACAQNTELLRFHSQCSDLCKSIYRQVTGCRLCSNKTSKTKESQITKPLFWFYILMFATDVHKIRLLDSWCCLFRTDGLIDFFSLSARNVVAKLHWAWFKNVIFSIISWTIINTNKQLLLFKHTLNASNNSICIISQF